MPSAIKEAFRSPFSRSNPASQFYNLSSYTRSTGSGSESIRDDTFQPDFNSQFHLGGVSQNNPNRLPSYQPQYPPLHPTNTGTNGGNYGNPGNLIQANYGLSLGNQNPNQNPTFQAEWAQQSVPAYLGPSSQPSLPSAYPANTNIQPTPPPRSPPSTISDVSTSSSASLRQGPTHPQGQQGQQGPIHPQGQQGQQGPPAGSECDDLINRVLSNSECRKTLKKLLNDNDEPSEKTLPPFKKSVEGFSSNSPGFELNNETLKTIIVYSLGGLLILCVLDLFVQLGKIIGGSSSGGVISSIASIPNPLKIT
jgi:hypothetical protein